MTSIRLGAFALVDIESIVIPNSIVKIENSAFDWSDEIKHVYFTGTKEEWESIEIGSYNGSLNKAEKHYNYIPE